MAALQGPSPKQLEVISFKTGEGEGIFEERLERLKQWAENHPYFKNENYDHLYPLFLRGCKHDLSRAQDKLNEFYLARTTCDVLYANWDVQDGGLQAAMKFLECVPLPQLTDDGYRVVIHRVSENDETSLKDIVRLLLMLADLRMKHEHAIAGDIYVFDVKRLRTAFLVKLVNPLLKKIFSIIEHAYPQRLKQIHIINAPSFMSNVVSMVKSLMKKKMRDRFVVHTSQNTLADYVPRSILPSDYQGDAESISMMNSYWVNELLNTKDEPLSSAFLLEDNSVHNNYKSITKEDVYGADGLFKTLQID